jgi:hypothetical protein
MGASCGIAKAGFNALLHLRAYCMLKLAGFLVHLIPAVTENIGKQPF